MTARIAVLASGGGTNLQALIDHFASLGARAPGRIVLVASDRKNAFALERARTAGIETAYVPVSAGDGALAQALASHRIDVVALAGYLRLIPMEVVRAYRGRIVNIHPALLPAFGGPGMYGHYVHEAVIAAGVKESGATVHFVDDQYDGGAIIAQARVPVLPTDTPETLAARVLTAEHRLYPPIVEGLCTGAIRLAEDGRVVRS